MIFLFLHATVLIIFFLVWVQARERLGWRSPGESPAAEARSRRLFQVRLALLALGLRLLCYVIILTFFPEMLDRLSPVYGWRDDLTYHEDASAIAALWQGQPVAMSEKVDMIDYVGYPLLLSVVYYLLWPSYTLGVLVNIAFGVLTCFFTYWLGREAFDEDIGRQGAILLAVLPMHIYLCCFTLKDPLVLFLLVVAIYAAFKATYARWSLLWLLPMLLSVFYLLFIRRQVSVGVLGLFLSGLVVGNFRRFLKLAPVLAVLVVISVQVYGQFKADAVEDFVLEGTLETQQSQLMQMKAVTPDLEGKFALIVGAFGYFLPFPTLVMLEEDVDPAYQLESSVLLWNLLAGISLVGIWYCLKRDWRRTWLIWFLPVVFSLGEALVYVHAVMDVRRSKFMLLPFACLLGVYALREWKSPARPFLMLFYGFAVVLGSLLYTYYRLTARGLM